MQAYLPENPPSAYQWQFDGRRLDGIIRKGFGEHGARLVKAFDCLVFNNCDAARAEFIAAVNAVLPLVAEPARGDVRKSRHALKAIPLWEPMQIPDGACRV